MLHILCTTRDHFTIICWGWGGHVFDILKRIGADATALKKRQ